MTDTGGVLQAVDVAVSYGDTRALLYSSFSIAGGELVAVVGPNGAGKSTLFKALAGFVDHEGDVVVHGEHCHHLERKAIAYIPQQSDLDLRFPITVSEVVMAGRRRFHTGRMRATQHDHATVASCLEQVDLAGTESRSLSTLSGGQVQRVLLARALAQEADVLLLDEALSGVDTRHTDELISLFSNLCARGTSVLVSTHDLGLVRSRFTRCLTVNGRVLGDGSPAVELSGDKLERLFGSPSGSDAA
jgi:ABC-type Mn2+/Zn2+ transport system ATPase subunit